MTAVQCDVRTPLFTQDGIKLGVFGINVSAAGGLSMVPERHEIDWDGNLALVQQAERAGFEAVIPFARFRGFEGKTNPWGRSFETYTWAAGLAAATSTISIFATSHSLTVSPVLAAKQLTTIDHISHGRVGLNVVAGWFEKELRMFSAEKLEHDERYDYLQEWMDVLQGLWSRDEDFDYAGTWLHLEGLYQQPKPVQAPRPPIMNAAFSPRGHDFAARNADIAFVVAADAAGARAKAAELRNRAEGYGRSLQVWMSAACVCADTDAAAEQLIERYQSHADTAAARNSLDWTMGGAQMPPEVREIQQKSSASTPGYPLVGSAERVAEDIAALHDAGIDGLAIVWMNYTEGLTRFAEQVMPLLQANGVRR